MHKVNSVNPLDDLLYMAQADGSAQLSDKKEGINADYLQIEAERLIRSSIIHL